MEHLTLSHWIWLALIALMGAFVNGVLGHGFSTLSVPLALMIVAQRILNPVLVLLEVILNAGSFLLSHREFPKVRAKVLPFAMALLPGVLLGSLVLKFTPAGSLRLITYGLLLPLVLFQAFGRHGAEARSEKEARPFGFATGAIYGLTTISGPILSVYFHRHRCPKAEYRAAISFLRLVESLLTALAYYALGLLTKTSLQAAIPLVPVVLLGLWLGGRALRWLSEGAFRHGCIVFNTFAVSFGLSRLLLNAHKLPFWMAHGGWVLITAMVLASRFPAVRPRVRQAFYDPAAPLEKAP